MSEDTFSTHLIDGDEDATAYIVVDAEGTKIPIKTR